MHTGILVSFHLVERYFYGYVLLFLVKIDENYVVGIVLSKYNYVPIQGLFTKHLRFPLALEPAPTLLPTGLQHLHQKFT